MKSINLNNTGMGLIGLLAFSFFTNTAFSQDQPESNFKKTVISRDFLSEGVAVADLNKDGQLDIIAGYYWFEAPDWKRHEISPSQTFDPRKEYSNSFLNLGMDVNLDGWDDVVIIDYPGTPAYWFENPKTESSNWQKHIIADSVGISNESPGFIDIDGDGRLDILCGDPEKKQIIWLQAPTKPGETKWKRFPLSEENVPGTDRFSHGLGYGDINGDGFKDVVIAEGWFEGKANQKSGDWIFHPVQISEPASHMQVLDVNGDMKNDVVSASAHSLGVWWQEQMNDSSFKTHLITNLTAQTHATIMADLNGNGDLEMISGKRYLAHNGNDAGDGDTPYLFYIEFTPGIGPFFREHIIDNDSGAGLNITVEDMNKDQKPDIVIANKNGIFLFENQIKK
ncbi:FG-GAP repeat domain-containing protein [Algoriphagus persicinus]|uniref:FG-GAP repeat domain-containing protein n=1 Tax=Algoriphagus persicinus TaxID=3108754 RepID=UPI002B37D359|nr:VCBS repeat-containing protein [Algoriphagus sp. E1-3-M2]MEB2784281.1 VCBS repeat-containing protein [Algoriphagus sp. E1-3-M2]